MDRVAIAVSRFLPMIALVASIASAACREPVVPGGDWKDDRGKVVSATEGGIIRQGHLWYMWGMDRSQNNSTFVGINLYSSPDLVHWTFVKQILRHDSDPLLDKNAVVERAKILRSPHTGKYVIWMHYEGHNAYNVAEVAWATADRIDGDFKFQGHFRPMDLDSRDLNVYQDDDGKAYLICTTKNNQFVSLFELDSTYTKLVREVYRGAASAGMQCEGHAIVKSKGRYYWMMSWCTGWDFNDNRYFSATSLAGPWSSGANVAPAGTHTYESQVGWAFTLPGTDGGNFVYMGDRWSVNDFSLSRMVMLPFTVSGTSLSVQWHDRWYPGQDTGWARGEPLFADGVYTLRPRGSNLVLGVPSKTSATRPRLVPDSGTVAQKWLLKGLGNSDYRFTSVHSGLTLEINGGSRDIGTAANQYATGTGFNQKWHIIQSAPNAWRLTNENTMGKILQVAGTSVVAGAEASLGAYKGGPLQDWEIVPATPLKDGSWYALRAEHSGKVLTTGTRGMEQRTIDGSPAQAWKARSAGSGWWTFEQAGKRLGVPGDSLREGASLGLVSDTGSASRWMLVDDGSGRFQVVNGCSGKSLDVDGGETATTDGAAVKQYRWWGTRNQQWTPRAVDPPSGVDRPVAPDARQILSVLGSEVRVGGDLASWERIEFRDPTGRLLAVLPIRSSQPLPHLSRGAVRVSLIGDRSRQEASLVVP